MGPVGTGDWGLGLGLDNIDYRLKFPTKSWSLKYFIWILRKILFCLILFSLGITATAQLSELADELSN